MNSNERGCGSKRGTAPVIIVRLPADPHRPPLFLYITIIKKERTLLIKSINHTGGVGSSVHPLARVSNQSSSLVMYSWEM